MKTDLKYARILDLFTRFREGKIINKSEEAVRYGVSERSVQRDIDSLRSYFDNRTAEGEIKKEIIYDQQRKGFRLVSREQESLEGQEIYAIMKMLIGSKGLVKEEMLPLLEKLMEFSSEEMEYKELKNLTANEMLNYTGPIHGKKLLEKIKKITYAINHQYVIKMQYKKLQSTELRQWTVKPVGSFFSEYYFYVFAYIKWEKDKGVEQQYPTTFRIDRIEELEVTEEHFSVEYAKRFDEYGYREMSPFIFGGEVKRLKFWYSGPSLEAILDRIPSAKVLEEQDGKYLMTAEIIGDGAEIWLRGQGENVNII